MRGVNRVTIIGNLGAEPDVRYGANGNAVTKISVATTEEWKNKNTGDKESKTEWHRIVFFGRLAEIAGEYLSKGSQVYVEGKLSTSKYEKDGQTHYSTDIICNELQMLGGRSQGENNRSQNGNDRAQGGQANADFDDGSDIPF